MNTKTTLILALVAAAIFGYVFLVAKPWEEQVGEQAPKTTAKALFDPKLEGVNRVELERRDGKKFVFAQDAKNGDEWRMLEPIEGPAAKYEVNSLVKKVSELKYMKQYAPDDPNYPSEKVSGLDKPIATVKLFKDDKLEAEIVFGSRLPTGKGNYFRLAGSDDIRESQDDLRDTFNKKLENYRDKIVVKFDLKDVERVSVQGASNYVLVKSGNDWLLESPSRGSADKNKAESVAQKLASLRVQDFKDDNPASYRRYGLDKPRLTLTAETREEVPPKAKPGDPDTKPADTQPSTEHKTYALHIGGAVDTSAKSYFARIESAPWVFSVSQSTFNDINVPLVQLRDKTIAKVETAKAKKVTSTIAGEVMTLSKQENGDWNFADGTQADTSAVGDLLKAINDLKASDFPDPSQLLVKIDWDKPRAKISVTQEGTLQPITVLVGPPSASGKMVHVRNAASEVVAVVRADDVEQLLQTPVSYRDRAVMSFERGRAKKIAISSPDGKTLTLTKATDNKWQLDAPINANADQDAVRNLLQDLSSLQAKRVASIGNKSKYGLDKPQVTVAVTVESPAAQPNAKVVKAKKDETSSAETKPATPLKERIANLEAVLRLQTQGRGDSNVPPEKIQEIQENLAKLKAEAAAQPGDLQQQIANYESLLEYQKAHPDKAKPELTETIKKELAKLKARAASKPAETTTKGADHDVAKASESQPAKPPVKLTTLRLHLAQHDGKTYACRPKSDTIYELDTQVFLDVTAEFHDLQITKFEVSDVTEVTFGTAEKPLVFRKDGDDWKYVPDPVVPIDKQKVTDALNDLREVKTHRYISYRANKHDLAKYGLNATADRLAVVLAGGQRIEVQVSKIGPEEDSDKSRYAILTGAPKVFLLKGEIADKFERMLDQFEKAGS